MQNPPEPAVIPDRIAHILVTIALLFIAVTLTVGSIELLMRLEVLR
jgi:hypothetical protein